MLLLDIYMIDWYEQRRQQILRCYNFSNTDLRELGTLQTRGNLRGIRTSFVHGVHTSGFVVPFVYCQRKLVSRDEGSTIADPGAHSSE